MSKKRLTAKKLVATPLDEWKEKAQDEFATKNILRKSFSPEVKEVEGGENQLDFRISTREVDRDNDTIEPGGWSTTSYEKNPVVLWAHQYDMPPIGRAMSLANDAEALLSRAQFTPADLNPFGHMVFRLYKEKFLNAVSVGFRPIKYVLNAERGGVDFAEQELLEYSAVPVPSNPGALVQARSVGIDLLPLKVWAEQTLDTWHEEKGVWIPKRLVEQAYAESREEKTISVGTASETSNPTEATVELTDGGGKSDQTPADPTPPPSAPPEEPQSEDPSVVPDEDPPDEVSPSETQPQEEASGAASETKAEAETKADPAPPLVKIGRVLSRENEGRLRRAMERLVDAQTELMACLDGLEHAPEAEDEPKAAEPAPKAEPPVEPKKDEGDWVLVVEDEPDLLETFEPEDIRSLIQTAVRSAMTAVTGRLD